MLQRLTITSLFTLFAIFLSAQTTMGTIQHDGITRDYILHLPTDYDESKSYPFVYNLHGFTSNAAQQQFYSSMDGTADTNGFIVCYPNGIDASWNVGWTFGSTADDVGFLIALVDELATEYSINTDRLYSCGMSNGGFMSYKLACDASDRFAAIASVTGAMVPDELMSCDPIRQMPVMQIHGTADPTVAYGGSFVSAPIEEIVNFWVEGNGCVSAGDTIQVENINLTDNSTAQRIQYTDCEDDNEVVFYKIDGGEHTWPDASLTIGVTNRDFNANQEIWNFFNRFDLNGPITSTDNLEAVKYEISVIPNPSSSNVLLTNLPASKTEITLIDAYGQVISSQENYQSTATVHIDLLKCGMYYITINGANGIHETVKFVKD